MANRDLGTLLRLLEVKLGREVEVRVMRNAEELGGDTTGLFEAKRASGHAIAVSRSEYGLLLAAGAHHPAQTAPPDPSAIAPIFTCKECGEPMHRPQRVEVARNMNSPASQNPGGAIVFYCAKCHAELFGDLERD